MDRSIRKELSISPLYFALVFIGLFVTFEFLYFLIPDSILNNVIYPRLITEPCTFIINYFQEDQLSTSYKQYIRSKTANLKIIRGCDGSGVFFLIIAAILAYKTTIMNKLVGILSASIFVYIINMARIIAVYFLISYYPTYFIPFHTLIAPSMIIILTSFLYLFWLTQINNTDV